MELKLLYEIQGGLKANINYKGEDKADKMLLAMLVEFGECAQEYRGFKYWSKDQKARIQKTVKCKKCDGRKILPLGEGVRGVKKCDKCDPKTGMITVYPLLEEYVDGLHFVLEQGLDLGLTVDEILDKDIAKWVTIEKQFISVFHHAVILPMASDREVLEAYYYGLVSSYIGLGYMLGFTDEQIYDAYMEKNRVNHERQLNSY